MQFAKQVRPPSDVELGPLTKRTSQQKNKLQHDDAKWLRVQGACPCSNSTRGIPFKSRRSCIWHIAFVEPAKIWLQAFYTSSTLFVFCMNVNCNHCKPADNVQIQSQILQIGNSTILHIFASCYIFMEFYDFLQNLKLGQIHRISQTRFYKALLKSLQNL